MVKRSKRRKSRRRNAKSRFEFLHLLLLLAGLALTAILSSPFLGDQPGEGAGNVMGRYGIIIADRIAYWGLGRYFSFVLPLYLLILSSRPVFRLRTGGWSIALLLIRFSIWGTLVVGSLLFLSGKVPAEGVCLSCGFWIDRLLDVTAAGFGWFGVLLLLLATLGVGAIFIFDLSILGIMRATFGFLGGLIGLLFRNLVEWLAGLQERFSARRKDRKELKAKTKIQAAATPGPPSEPEFSIPDEEPEPELPTNDPPLPDPEETVDADVTEPQENDGGELQETSEQADGNDPEYSLEDEVVEEEVAFQAERREFMQNYRLPSVELLDEIDSEKVFHISPEEMRDVAARLEEALLNYKISAKVAHVAPGPVVTRYELDLAPGIKVNQIHLVSEDLARELAAPSIRILSHIPGKSLVGVEVPNPRRNTVYLRSIVNTEKFSSSESPLLIALGKTSSGEAFVVDLQKMPHLLIAGQTGAGKSVCINAILASFLFRASPTDVQLVLVDPKMVELAEYKSIADHFICTLPGLGEEVITRPDNAVHILNAVTEEMERRYELLSQNGFRNIMEYNEALDLGALRELANGDSPQRMVFLVVVIDELADLMMTAGKDIETPIARLAQKARAVGIHLVVATQRPSVNVITGPIKANFPARIAFAVTQRVDSQTILDTSGAEKLLGYGDMLYMGLDSPRPMRVHGSFLNSREIRNILKHVRKQSKRFTKFRLEDIKIKPDHDDVGGSGDRDPLFLKALEIVTIEQRASISLLQRKMKIGYNRAARVIDQMEDAGYVGPADGSKPREVYRQPEELGNLEDW